jgi:hypothetical protein
VVNPKSKLVAGSWRQIEGKKHTQTGRGSQRDKESRLKRITTAANHTGITKTLCGQHSRARSVGDERSAKASRAGNKGKAAPAALEAGLQRVERNRVGIRRRKNKHEAESGSR